MNGSRPEWKKLKCDLRARKIERYCDDSYWVVVPRDPATFGHLLVISWRGYDKKNQDISDKGLFEDPEPKPKHMYEIMGLIHELASMMKKSLKYGERRCERVYVATLCETKDFPFHFHLIPRFEGDKTGFMFLFERELEEVRWMLENDKKHDKIAEACNRIGKSEGILDFHKYLVHSNEWVRSNEERKGFICQIREEINRILDEEPS